jgi:hypothetical protein
MDQDIIKSFEICFYNNSEKYKNNVTLRLASFTYFNLNVNSSISLKKDKSAERNMFIVVNDGLSISPP